VLETGALIGLGLLATLVKLSWQYKMILLSNPVWVDVVIFIALTLIHWGSFSGPVVAAIGALCCSLTLSAGRSYYGYIENGLYVRGFRDVETEWKADCAKPSGFRNWRTPLAA